LQAAANGSLRRRADCEVLQLNHKPNVQRKLDSMVIRSSKGRLSKRRRVLASAALVVTGMTFQALGFLDG